MYLKTQTTEVINLKCESCDILRKSLYPTPNRNVSNAKIAWCFFSSSSSTFNESKTLYNVKWENLNVHLPVKMSSVCSNSTLDSHERQ